VVVVVVEVDSLLSLSVVLLLLFDKVVSFSLVDENEDEVCANNKYRGTTTEDRCDCAAAAARRSVVLVLEKCILVKASALHR
jgi:hypothetical protein